MIQLKAFERRVLALPTESIKASPILSAEEYDYAPNFCLHHVTEDPSAVAIRGSSPLLRNWSKNGRTGVYVIENNPKEFGSVRYAAKSASSIQAYFQNQSSLTKVRKLERSLNIEKLLLIMDYSDLYKRMIVPSNKREFYARFKNVSNAIIDQIDRTTATRNNVIAMQFPDALPPKEKFKMLDGKAPDDNELNTWVSDKHWWLRELWLVVHGLSGLNEVLKKSSVFATIVVGTGLVTLDLKRLAKEGEENPDKTSNRLYALFDKLASLQSEVDTEALKDFDDITVDKATKTVEEQLLATTRDAVKAGTMTPREQERFIKIAAKSQEISYFNDEPIYEYAKTDINKDYTITKRNEAPVDDKITDGQGKSSLVDEIHGSYINGAYQKHMAAVLTSFGGEGYILTDFDYDEHKDLINDYAEYSFKLLPLKGRETKITQAIPKVREDGQFKIDGVQYSMDGQLVDAPIRKVSPNKVSMTSYYGKLFVSRSEQKAHDYVGWLKTAIMKYSLDTADKRVTSLKRGKLDKPANTVPRVYSGLSSNIVSFNSNGIKFWFDWHKRAEFFSPAQLKLENKERILVGKKGDAPVFMKHDNALYTLDGNKEVYLSDLARHVGVTGRPPVDTAVINVFGRPLGLGLVFCTYYGIDKTLKLFNATTKEFPGNQRDHGMDPYEWLELRFKDKRLFVKKDNAAASLVMAGVANLKDTLRSYNYSDFNRKETFNPLYIEMGFNSILFNEVGYLRRFFIDPMTRDALKSIDEPTEWRPLLQRAVELLTNDDSPRETDPQYQRIRGYERIPGQMYYNLVQAIKKHENSPSQASSRLEFPPNTIWRKMQEDTSTQLVQNANPIHKLKQQEALTLGGDGGRSARTLTLKQRVVDKNSVGILSESTPDSAKVGIRRYMTPDAKIKSTLGFMGMYDSKDDPSNVLSTTAKVLPASHHEDPKRTSLGNGQYSSIVPTKGSIVAPYCTGYERVIGSRVGDEYCFVAKRDAEVTKVSNDRVVITYADGEKSGVKIGRWHGEMAGAYVAHDMVTDVEVGQKLKAGAIVAWDSGFFERDFLDLTRRNVILKHGVFTFVALKEGNDNLEDGSAISPELAEGLTTVITKRKTFLFSFDAEVSNMRQVGEDVNYADPLMTISKYLEDIEGLDSDIRENLARFSGASPKAGFTGTVTNVELIYMGDKGEMSPSLRELADAHDAAQKKDARDLGGNLPTSCEVSRSTFWGGERVTENTMAISYYIDVEAPSGVGDKTVFSNQLKSIHGRVMSGINETESGLKLGASFGLKSVFARIVESALIQGGFCRIQYWASHEFARLLLGE